MAKVFSLASFQIQAFFPFVFINHHQTQSLEVEAFEYPTHRS
jgi:hypothetical protein